MLSLHGAGKHLAKGEASRVLRHLVIEDFLVEDVKKSDIYGSVSSILKVTISFFTLSFFISGFYMHSEFCLKRSGCDFVLFTHHHHIPSNLHLNSYS